jgi:DTW domain-containing protein YfiP
MHYKGSCFSNFCDLRKEKNFTDQVVHTEVYRGTNTGVLVTLNANNSEILICGKDEDEEKLRKMIEEEPDTTVVMYPSQDSVVVRTDISYTCVSCFRDS